METNRLLLRRVGGVLVGLFVCGAYLFKSCDPRSESLGESEIPGIYRADWMQSEYGTETLTMRANGTYLQEFISVNSQRSNNSGSWTAKRSSTGKFMQVHLSNYQLYYGSGGPRGGAHFSIDRRLMDGDLLWVIPNHRVSKKVVLHLFEEWWYVKQQE